MGVSSAFIYVWKRTREGEKQIFFGPVNMPLTQVNTNDDRPRPLYLWENIYYESKVVFTCNTSVEEKNWEILSRRYTGKRVSVLEVKNDVQSLLLYLFETVLTMTLFSIVYMNTCVSSQYFDKQH